MCAASLLLVFVFAKLAVLSRHVAPITAWSPVAYFWQDVLVALLFAGVVAIERRAFDRIRVSHVLYWVMVVAALANVPVGRALATPITWRMIGAAGGALGDSFRWYATWDNVVLTLGTLAVGGVFPLLLRKLPLPRPAVVLVLASLIVAFGQGATRRVETFGLDRNVILAAIRSPIRSYPSVSVHQDLRILRAGFSPVEDLSRFRGIAAGKNVIVVSLESTAAQYLPLYRGEYDVMPNLTELAGNAIVFESSYAIYPESIKGLFSVLCSVPPAMDSRAEAYEKVPCRSVAAVLAGKGYRTGMFHSGRFAYLGMEAIVRNRGFETLEDAGDIGGQHESSFGVDEPSTVARMLAWVDARPAGQPFLLTYLPIAGHHPYESPRRGPFPEHDEIGRYRNALHYGDESLGVLMEGLRARGLWEKTVWVIYGDHGEAFGQHAGNYGHVFHLYEENVRVPFLIAAPGAIGQAVRARKTVSLLDTAPTILDLVGVDKPVGYYGRSALDPVPTMAFFFTDYSVPMIGLRDRNWKFIYEPASGRMKLFDLSRDPKEKANVADEHQDLVTGYGEVLRYWVWQKRS